LGSFCIQLSLCIAEELSGGILSGSSEESSGSESLRPAQSDRMDQRALGRGGGGRKRWFPVESPVMTEATVVRGGFMVTSPSQRDTLPVPSSSINRGGASEDEDSAPEVIPESPMDASNSPPPASLNPVHPVSH
jgi:hypothetical protein